MVDAAPARQKPGEIDTVLLVIDLQRDFVTGALPVPGAEDVIQPIAKLVERFPAVATQDWHREDDPSFEVNGGKWPVHCVAGTPGAEPYGPIANHANVRAIFRKQGYSAFGNTALAFYLLSLFPMRTPPGRVIICGLALDYCVKATALDAIRAGFETIVALDCTRAVDPTTKAQQAVLEELTRAGVKCYTSDLLG